MLLNTVRLTDTFRPEAAAAAFEREFENTGSAAIEDFLPPQSHPQYLPVLAQLLRLDMRFQWAVGCRRYLDDYRQPFPARRYAHLQRGRWRGRG